MTIENVVRHIINHHNQVGDDVHHRYWHQKLEEEKVDVARQIIKKLDHSQHHIGDCYRQSGMRVDLNRKSHEATAILKVMNFIVGGLTKGDGREDKSVEVDEKMFFETQTPDCDIVDDYESELFQYNQIYNVNAKQTRTLTQADLPEEFDIKAIAVSILAETNGSVKMAKEILSVAGLKVIKRMNIADLQHLRADLKSISTQTEANTQNVHFHSKL